MKLLILFFTTLLCFDVSLKAQNTAITIFHSQGYASSYISANDEFQEIYEGQSEFWSGFYARENNPWVARRTSLEFSYNAQGMIVYSAGIGYNSNSSTFIIDIDPYWDRRGIFRARYNDAINGRVVETRNFLTIPIEIDYYLRRNKKVNYFLEVSAEALFRSNSIWRSRGFDQEGEKVKPRRISSIDNSIKKTHYAVGFGFSAQIKFSKRMDFLTKIDSDYTLGSSINDDELYKQAWLTYNLGLGVRYNLGSRI